MTHMIQIRLMAFILSWFDCIMHLHSFAKTLALRDTRTGKSHRILAKRANTPKEWGWSGGRSKLLVNFSIRVWVDYPVSYCPGASMCMLSFQTIVSRVKFVHSQCRIPFQTIQSDGSVLGPEQTLNWWIDWLKMLLMLLLLDLLCIRDPAAWLPWRGRHAKISRN